MFDATQVDLVTVTPQSDAVLVYIVASEEWTGNDEQLRSLQEKIQNYLGYAVDLPHEREAPHVGLTYVPPPTSCLNNTGDGATLPIASCRSALFRIGP